MSKDLFQEDLFSETYDDLVDVISPEEVVDDLTQEVEHTEETTETSETSEQDEIIDDEEDSSTDSPEEVQVDDKVSPLLPYANMLVEDGILTHFKLEDFDGTAEGLKLAVQNEIKVEKEAYIQGLDPRIKLLVESMEAGVPFETLLQMDKSMIELSQIDDTKLSTDTKLQKEIAFKYFKKTTRFDDVKIAKLIEKFEDIGELQSEASNFLSELKEMEAQEYEQSLANAETNRIEQEKVRLQSINKLQEDLKKTTEFIPGIALTDKVREKVFKTITTPVAQDQQGNPVNKVTLAAMQDPDFNVKLTYLFEITEGFKKFDVFLNPGKKKAISELEQAASRLDSSRGQARSKPVNRNASLDLDNLL